MNKYSIIFAPHVVERGRVGDVAHREMGYIPFCTPAVDVFRVDDEGYLTIHNPAPKVILPWDPHFDVKTGYKNT